MPFTTTWEERGTLTTFSGDVTGQDIIRATTAIHGDARFDSIRYIIGDFMEGRLSITLEEVREIAALDNVAALTNPRVKVAIVSNSETVEVGGALYKSDSEWETEAFASLDDARRWVGAGD